MSEWDDPIEAQPGEWNGIRYDSKLELSWMKTLDEYGFDWRPHPGPVDLGVDGTWQPDLMVSGVLAEVKPWAGESVERLWKPYRATELYGLPVLILRPGLVPADWDVEQAGCDWSSTDGERWVIDMSSGFGVFRPWSEELAPAYVHDAAALVLSDGDLHGLPMMHHSHSNGDDT